MGIYRTTWLALAVLGGCGNPLAGSDYRGDPLFSFQGRVMSYVGGKESEHEFRVSLFWSPGGLTRAPVEQLVEQTSASVRIQFPSTFLINVFYPPEDSHLVNAQPAYGLALVLVYRDLDGNRRFTPGAGELVGGAEDHVLLYAPRALDKDRSPTGLPLPKGFSVIPIPLDCDQTYHPYRGDQDCGPELGASCQTDADCPDGGECLTRLGDFEVPGGYCALKLTDGGCAPNGGTVLQIGDLYWLRTCFANDDCSRPGYACTDLDHRPDRTCKACWPENAPPISANCATYENWYADPACGEKLGLACERDADCKSTLDEGKCLRDLAEVTFPDGYCTHADPSFGCTPRDGRYLVVYTNYWFRQCEADDDCRKLEGYTCDTVYRVCLPVFPVELSIHPGFTPEKNVETLCY